VMISAGSRQRGLARMFRWLRSAPTCFYWSLMF
jgi:hypothetical protein